MVDGAVAWAATAMGATIQHCERLTGGQTSTMLALTDISGSQSVLRLITEDPWRRHGPDLTRREQAAQRELAGSATPAPVSLALDADGSFTGVSAHLMSRLPGVPTAHVEGQRLHAMADTLAAIHDVRPAGPFRTYESWAWNAKWVVPGWSRHPSSWQRAFDLLAQEPPAHVVTFLHRDFSHRNLLWIDDTITGVVDWVETSTGPAWLDAGHAASNLAVGFGSDAARCFLEAYAATTGSTPERYWLVMDAVGFLPPPGRDPMFASTTQLARLDEWLDELVTDRPRR